MVLFFIKLGTYVTDWMSRRSPALAVAAPVVQPPALPATTTIEVPTPAPVAVKESDDGLPLTEAMEQIFEQVGSLVLERIRKVNKLTESEVLSAGDALNRIVVEAKAHVDGTKATLSAIANDRSDESVTSVVTRQVERSEAFLVRTESLIKQQSKSANHAMGLSKRIAELGDQISLIAFQSRLLSLNASIEAARLNTQGAAFGVISVEMKRLSDAVEVTNQTVAALARELAEALPDIAKMGFKLLESSQQFRGELESGLSEIQNATTSLKSTIADSLSDGDQRIDRVIHESHAALSHLQFQDVCAQSLLIIDSDLDNTRFSLRDLVNVAGVAEATVSKDVNLKLNVATSNRDLVAGEVVTFNDDGDAPEAGEVMLF